jgi:hypothetical protein
LLKKYGSPDKIPAKEVIPQPIVYIPDVHVEIQNILSHQEFQHHILVVMILLLKLLNLFIFL